MRRFAMKTLRGEKVCFDLQTQGGAALVIAVLILLILTVVGIYAVTSSTLETKIAGTERVLQEAFHAADGGVDYGRRVINLVLTNQSLPGGTDPHDEDNTTLLQEMIGDSTSSWQSESPWIAPTIGKCDMVIHIDRIKAEEPAGFSGEFGAPASEKQTTVYYKLDSASSGIAGASSEIEATYRRLVHE
jgi:Na+-transporting methylmalonyl-CoA/oxaloacetate decarboxylase gamma subunit